MHCPLVFVALKVYCWNKNSHWSNVSIFKFHKISYKTSTLFLNRSPPHLKKCLLITSQLRFVPVKHEQTHFHWAALVIWCCSKDISKWIGSKIILFTSINRSILATSNQMRCCMCRSRDSALSLPTLQCQWSTMHKFNGTKLPFICIHLFLLMLQKIQQKIVF